MVDETPGEHDARCCGAADFAAGRHDGNNRPSALAVEWNDSGRAAGLPDHLFLKSTPLSAKNRTMVAALGMAVNEARFYNEAADELRGVAPRSWYARAGVGARFLIVLEDIVAAGGRPYALADMCDIGHAQGLIDAFATLHARFWESPRLVGDLSWVRTWSTRPGYGVLKTFYSRGRRGALRRERPEVTPAVRAVAAALDTHADAYYREFESGPLTLLHGDSHLGNTFAWADGRSGLLDWQVVWRGPGLREVSYWMTSAWNRRCAALRSAISSSGTWKVCGPAG